MTSFNESTTLSGYVTVRSFSGMAIPVPVQNMILRNYCTSKYFSYGLPQGEHKFENCYMQLFTTLAAVPHGGHIGMCSAMMLPIQKDLSKEIISITCNKKISIHFVFESSVCQTLDAFADLFFKLKLRHLIDSLQPSNKYLKQCLRNEIQN